MPAKACIIPHRLRWIVMNPSSELLEHMGVYWYYQFYSSRRMIMGEVFDSVDPIEKLVWIHQMARLRTRNA
jgi:hypothetical protein